MVTTLVREYPGRAGGYSSYNRQATRSQSTRPTFGDGPPPRRSAICVRRGPSDPAVWPTAGLQVTRRRSWTRRPSVAEDGRFKRPCPNQPSRYLIQAAQRRQIVAWMRQPQAQFRAGWPQGIAPVGLPLIRTRPLGHTARHITSSLRDGSLSESAIRLVPDAATVVGSGGATHFLGERGGRPLSSTQETWVAQRPRVSGCSGQALVPLPSGPADSACRVGSAGRSPLLLRPRVLPRPARRRHADSWHHPTAHFKRG